jgi:hypothetical protein
MSAPGSGGPKSGGVTTSGFGGFFFFASSSAFFSLSRSGNTAGVKLSAVNWSTMMAGWL